MMPAAIDTLTPQQLDAALAIEAKALVPAEQKPLSLTERLGRFGRVLLKYHEKGYSSDQLVALLHQPSIGIDVSPSLVRKVLRQAAARKKEGTASTPWKADLTPRVPANG